MGLYVGPVLTEGDHGYIDALIVSVGPREVNLIPQTDEYIDGLLKSYGVKSSSFTAAENGSATGGVEDC